MQGDADRGKGAGRGAAQPGDQAPAATQRAGGSCAGALAPAQAASHAPGAPQGMPLLGIPFLCHSNHILVSTLFDMGLDF